MDKIQSLYESYLAEGIISPSTTLEQFTSANEEQQSTLYNQGIEANILSKQTGFDLFQSAWGLKKKEDTELPSPVGSLEQPEPVEKDSEAFKKFKANALEMASGIARIPMLVAENAINAATALNPELQSYLDELPLEERENFISSIANAQGGVMGMTGASNEAARKLKQSAEEIQETVTQYDTGITEDIFSENVVRGLSRLLDEVVGTAPSLALAFIPGGIGVIGAGSAAEKSRALQEKGEDLDYKTFINAVGSGTAEGIFENYTRKLIPKSIFKQLVGKTKEQALVTAKKISNSLLKGFGIEGGSETATLLSQKMLDAFVTGDEEAFVNIVGETLDTFLIGGAVGAPLNTLSPGIRAISQKRRKNKLNKLIDKSKYKDITESFKIEKGKPTVELEQLEIISSPDSRLFLEGTLAKQVTNNTLSEGEAKAILEAYDNAASLVYETSDLDISQDKKVEAMLLVDEKRKLENLIAGKDQALSKKERIRIDEINDSLEKISLESGVELSIEEATKEDAIKALQEEGITEPSDKDILEKLDELTKQEKDAIQKSGSKKVDVSKSTEDSTKVGEGDKPISKPTDKDTPQKLQEEGVIVEDKKVERKALDFAPRNITLKKPVKQGDNEVLLGRDAELEVEVIERKLNKAKEKGTNPKQVVADLQRRLALEANDAEFFADYIENFLAGRVTTPFSEWRKGEKTESFKTKRIKITEPFTIGTVQVLFNEDGSIKSIINKRTNKEVAASTRPKYEKIILEKVIDIDAGEKAPIIEGIKEEEGPSYIADNSNNVREIAETIRTEEARIEQNKDLQATLLDEQDLKKILGLKFTSKSWKKQTGKSPKQSKIEKVWIDDSFNVMGEPEGVSLEDGWLKRFARQNELPVDTGKRLESLGIGVDDIIEFIKNNNTPSKIQKNKKIKSTPKTPSIIDLELKFEELTGAKPTPDNINLVVGIEEGRVPVELLKLQEQQKLSEPAIDEKGEVVEGGAFGKKKGPSAEKITAPPKKEITVDEAKALKDQIRLEARAAREAKLDIKKKRAQIKEFIKGIKSKAQITTAQAFALTNKINSLNVDNEVKVEEFIEYADKVVKNAELADKIQKADNLRKTAKKNIKTKIGTAKDLFPALESLFNIKIQAIPLDKIDSYLELAEAFGERKSVLTLPEKGLALQQADDILNSIEDEAQITDDAKVKEDDYNLKEEIDNIINNRIEVPTLIEPEKVIADYLNSLSKEDIEGLVTEKDGKKNYSQVEKLKNVLANIENGYVPKVASELEVYGKANKSSNKISPVIGKLKFNVLEQGIEKVIAKAKAGLKSRKRDVIGKQIGAAPLTNIDEALGNFNKKDIARETFDYLASEYSKYEVALGKIDNILSEAEALLTQGKRGKFSKRLLNQSIKAKYKIMAYQLQREFESNNGKKGTASALDFIDATVDAIKSEEQNFLLDNDVKILEEIKKEFTVEGKIDNDKIINSLSPREKKALSLIDQANQSLAEKALFTSGVLRGNRVNLFSNYVHHDVIMKNEDDVKEMLNNKRERMTKPSTKSKTLLERTPGAKPISFDPISSAGRAAKETLLDFHMTQPIRIVNKTLSNVIETIESDPNSTKLQRGTAKAVKDAFEEINSIIFDNTYQEIGVADKFLEKAKKLGYYAALASLPRAGAELGSNLSFALLSNPQGLATGIKNYGKYSMGAEGAEVLDAIGSSQTLKLYNKEALTGKMADTNLYQRGKDKRGKAVNPVSETINYLYNNLPIIKGPVEATRVISENLISTPDKAISRPLYFDTFVRAFAEATKKSGKEIKLTSKDFKNINEFVAKYPDEIKEAREKADDENIRMATTVNPYSGILKLQPKKGDSTLIKVYKQANGYMARFTLFEYSTFRKAVRALYTDGEISKGQGAGLIAGSVARMTSYMILYQFLSNMFDTVMGGMFGLDVEEEEDGLENQLMRQLVGTGSTLILRRAVGNVPAIPISLLIEYLNEQYGEDLRSGEEYDEFENSLVFSQIGLNELRKSTAEVIGTKALLGPYTPLARSISRGVKVVQGLTGSAKEETKQKYMDELTLRMAIEAAGNVGLLPFYKDVRRILLKDMFKDKPKESKKGSKYTEKDFKNAKGNPAKQKYIRERINLQKKQGKSTGSRPLPGVKK